MSSTTSMIPFLFSVGSLWFPLFLDRNLIFQISIPYEFIKFHSIAFEVLSLAKKSEHLRVEKLLSKSRYPFAAS